MDVKRFEFFFPRFADTIKQDKKHWRFSHLGEKLHSMFEVMVEDKFSSARHLLHYEGPCANVHGHNFVVRIWARGNALDEANVFIDYAVLKKALKVITDELDHTDLNEHPDLCSQSPSTEYLAHYFFKRLKPDIPELYKTCVCETPTTCAYYWE